MGSHGPFVSHCGQDSFGKQLFTGRRGRDCFTECTVRHYILKPKLTKRRAERILTQARQSVRKSGRPGSVPPSERHSPGHTLPRTRSQDLRPMCTYGKVGITSANFVPDKGTKYLKCKELLQLGNKKTNDPIKPRAKDGNTLFRTDSTWEP